MTDTESKLRALHRAVDDQARSFHARDVWEHEAVRAAYRLLKEHGRRRQVGKDIKAYHRELGLTVTDCEEPGYGQLWEKA